VEPDRNELAAGHAFRNNQRRPAVWRTICIRLDHPDEELGTMSHQTRRLSAFIVVTAGVVLHLTASADAAADYPLTLTAQAKAGTATTSITSVVTIRVDRLMEENRYKRVTDALRYSGYSNFVAALRALPAIGAIEVEKRSVEIRYAREEPEGAGRRLVIVADRPLFFLGSDPQKSRAGFELTVVELRVDPQGAVTGTMAGAARVKPSPNGVVLDDFAEAPVSLTARMPGPTR
jgi:hypothetical protein